MEGAVLETLNKVPDGGDPVLMAAKWLALLVVVVVVGAGPVFLLFRKIKAQSLENSRDDAGVALYRQLQEQVETNAKDIRALVLEKNHWRDEAARLTAKLALVEAHLQQFADADARLQALSEQVSGYADLVSQLRSIVDQKDRAIEARDIEVDRLQQEIRVLRERIQQMEIRLARDETVLCARCGASGAEVMPGVVI